MKYLELADHLEKGGPGPVYLVLGEEDYLRDRAVQRIQEAAVSQDSGLLEFNRDMVYGDEADASEILAKAEEAPAFAARRCLIVKAADKLSARDGERLLPYLKAPTETTTVIFATAKLDGRTKFAQALKDRAVTVECSTPFESQIGGWITHEAAALNVRLTDEALGLLKELAVSLKDATGGVLYLIRRELEKLAAYVPAGGAADAAAVAAVRGGEAGASVFDLSHAIAARDRARAVRILVRNLEAGEDPLRILGSLVWQYRTIWKAKEALREGKLGQAEGLLQARRRGPSFNTRDFLARFSEPHLVQAFTLFLETDSRLKGGAAAAARARTLEHLVLRLCDSLGPQARSSTPAALSARPAPATTTPASRSKTIKTVRTVRKVQ